MKNPMDRKLFGIVSLVFALLMLITTSAWSAPTRAGDTSHRFSGKKAAHIGAIEKTGFYTGIVKEKVTILDEKSYRKLSYLAASNMIVTRQEQVIELDSLLPHSIVKLIIVNAEVVEIILIQESS